MLPPRNLLINKYLVNYRVKCSSFNQTDTNRIERIFKKGCSKSWNYSQQKICAKNMGENGLTIESSVLPWNVLWLFSVSFLIYELQLLIPAVPKSKLASTNKWYNVPVDSRWTFNPIRFIRDYNNLTSNMSDGSVPIFQYSAIFLSVATMKQATMSSKNHLEIEPIPAPTPEKKKKRWRRTRSPVSTKQILTK